MTIVNDRSMRSFDQDGRLHVERSNISKANVCPYLGKEISDYETLGLDPEKIYNLYRDPAELEKAAPTYHNIPLLIKHVAVSAEAPKKELIVGTVSDVKFEAPYLTASLAVWDQAAIDLIQSEAQDELSCGYYFTADMTPGTADGQQYDGVMRDLKANHVALVTEGRAGKDVAVADQSLEMTEMRKHILEIVAPFLAKNADKAKLRLAIDEALLGAKDPDEQTEDKENDYYGCTAADWAEMSAEDRKAARDKFKKAKDKKARDNSEDDSDYGATNNWIRPTVGPNKDSALAADQMRRQMLAAVEARDKVRPIVGTVALDAKGMDSADAVYAFALKHMQVKTDGIHASAFRSLFEAHAARRKPVERSAMGFDAAHTVASVWRVQS